MSNAMLSIKMSLYWTRDIFYSCIYPNIPTKVSPFLLSQMTRQHTVVRINAREIINDSNVEVLQHFQYNAKKWMLFTFTYFYFSSSSHSECYRIYFFTSFVASWAPVLDTEWKCTGNSILCHLSKKKITINCIKAL